MFNVFNAGEVDRITDFEDGLDLLRLRGVEGRFDGLEIGTVDGHAQITVQGHVIVLLDVSAGALDASDFLFIG